jgi:G5 domain.
MNLYLLNLVGKWIGILFVTLTSFFGGYEEKEITTYNTNKNMNLQLTTEVIPFQTEIKYNNQKPRGEETILTEGVNGYVIKNHATGAEKVMKYTVNEVKEVGTYVEYPKPSAVFGDALEAYTGILSVYYSNCPGSCSTSTGHSLKYKGVTYNDPTYGTVRILSAAQVKFKAGTIIEIVGTPLGPVHAIVLDMGGDMINAWYNGRVHMDLAVDPANEPGLASFYSRNVTFKVKRWGY